MISSSLNKIGRNVLLSLCAATSTCSMATASFAQAVESPPKTSSETINDDVPELSQIKKDLFNIRKLEFLLDVPSEIQSVDEFREYVEGDLDETYPAEEFEQMMNGLMRLGVVSEKFDLGEAFINAILTQAAAYYDPESKKFYYLMADMPEAELRTVAAHELVHALQDQHYDLNRILSSLEEAALGSDDGAPRNDDVVLAIRSLVEGEATYVQMIWQLRDQMNVDILENRGMEEMAIKGAADMDIEQMMEIARQTMGDLDPDNPMAKAITDTANIPRYILTPLYAAYMKGAYFTMKLRHSTDSWDGLEAAWDDLPTTTEQILHPEKYTSEQRDMPTMLVMPAFDYLKEAGWTEIDSAIHGELYLNLLLREQNDPKRAADNATAGWDGDIYTAWQNDKEDVMIALATTWDTEKDANQFFKAWRRVAENKYPNMEYVKKTEGHDTFECGDKLGFAEVRQRGKEVFIVEGATEKLASKMMTDLLDMPIDHVDTMTVEEINATNVSNIKEQSPDDLQAAAHLVETDGFIMAIPQGWQSETTTSESRVAQFLLPNKSDVDDAEADFVIYHFGDGHGGSFYENIERWDSQVDSDQPALISHREVDGIMIHQYEEAGRYVAETRPGSGQRVNKPNHRMIAVVIEADGGPYFVKIVGPETTINDWRAEIDQAIDSLESK